MGLFTMPTTVYMPLSNSGILSPTLLLQATLAKSSPKQDAAAVGGREPVPAGLDVQAPA